MPYQKLDRTAEMLSKKCPNCGSLLTAKWSGVYCKRCGYWFCWIKALRRVTIRTLNRFMRRFRDLNWMRWIGKSSACSVQ